MKPEIHIEVCFKGAEVQFDGGQVTKAKVSPPLISKWIPIAECECATFKLGKKEFLLTIERVRKPMRSKNGK